MESSASKLLHGLLLALAVGAASFVGTRAAVGSAASNMAQPVATAPSSEQAEMLAVLRAIEARLKEPPLQAPSATPGRSELLAAQGSAQLASVLDKLSAQLESMAAAGGSGAGTPPPPMREKDMAAVVAAGAVPEPEFDKAHAMMTTAELLERFGRPDAIRPSANGQGDKWRYILNEEKTLIFWVKDGRVTAAFYDP